MANFIYNPHSGESFISQWKNYTQQSSYFEDFTGAVNQLSKDTRKAIESASEDQANAMREATEIVSGTLEDGFRQLSEHVDSVGADVREVGALLDWKMTLMLEEQRMTNLLSENIVLLLRISDFQKERQYYIDQGLKHLKNASIDQDLYNDALENLQRAEQLEKTDYVVLHYIGYIYLRGTPCIDFVKAEDYLKRAAKYAMVETDPRSERLINILAGDVKKKLSEGTSQPKAINRVAADSYYLASISCYNQNKFSDAAELAGKAYSLAPDFLEAGFTQARALVAAGNIQQVATILEGVIKKDWTYSLKSASDTTLASSLDVRILLQEIRDIVIREASERLSNCKKQMIDKSLAVDIIDEIKKNISQNTYRDGLLAIEKLSCKRTWSTEVVRLGSHRKVLEVRTEITIKNHLLSLLGDCIACLLENGTVLIFNRVTGEIESTLSNPDFLSKIDHIVPIIALSPDSRYLVRLSIGSMDKNGYASIYIVLYEIATCEVENFCVSSRAYSSNRGVKVNMFYYPNGETIVVSFNNLILGWNGVKRRQDFEILHPEDILSFDYCTESNALVVESKSGKTAYDPLTGEWLRENYNSKIKPTDSMIWTLKKLTGNTFEVYEQTDVQEEQVNMSIEEFIPYENQRVNEIQERKTFFQIKKQENANCLSALNKADDILKKAGEKENEQKSKWFSKDYAQAIQLYEQAAELGSTKAKRKLRELK